MILLQTLTFAVAQVDDCERPMHTKVEGDEDPVDIEHIKASVGSPLLHKVKAVSILAASTALKTR